ncbi:hypothetical protein PGT21_027728 [Puccinia graminis f. sp. tritici]|uniref:Uncharacterized protein n=1 Tax=Puccinia graminis f. sp. tritici TaxID=56615 RepID=A0A5B0PV57_PUCGR|nr:hypothetical protein PGT21_027728 [Puccinia graminis f. sp. tritici]
MTVQAPYINLLVKGLNEIFPLDFSGVCKLEMKEKSFGLDKGICNIYLITMAAKSSSYNDTQGVYHKGERLIQTIVASCLEDLGHNLSLGLKYKVKGVILRDDSCGTTWEFNPMLSKLSTKSRHLIVTGTGRVNTVNLGCTAGKGEPAEDEVLVNHQPLSIDWNAIHKGSALEFSGQFVGEETESGIIRLLEVVLKYSSRLNEGKYSPHRLSNSIPDQDYTLFHKNYSEDATMRVSHAVRSIGTKKQLFSTEVKGRNPI